MEPGPAPSLYDRLGGAPTLAGVVAGGDLGGDLGLAWLTTRLQGADTSSPPPPDMAPDRLGAALAALGVNRRLLAEVMASVAINAPRPGGA